MLDRVPTLDGLEQRLSRTRWRWPAAFVTALLLLGAAVLAGATIASLVTGSFSPRIAGRVLIALPAIALMYGAFLLAVLVFNLPVLALLWMLRRRVPLGAARAVAAAGFLIWGQWALYRMEAYDVWRHGVPAVSYWLTSLLPWAVGLCAAGAVIGGTIVRDREGRPVSSAA
ncbi:MAG TPA: hypothetical protein VF198_16465 [Vicinamibacterales bacterium]